MTASRHERHARRTPRPSERRGLARLHVEQLESRLVPSLSAGTDVPGQLLVRFEPGVTPAEVADFYADYALTEQKDLDFDRADTDPGLRLVTTPTQQARELIPTLQRDWRVRYAEP